ncbi:hypothetical protein CSA37_11860 [Candidatus Fermentibacteria bacterium]|nr:MAG: hypothetical protein CSA37_11860 [Candidatus Fermentibacteria bacterium]
MSKAIIITLMIMVTASVAGPSIYGVPGLYRVNSAKPMGFNEMSFSIGFKYWAAVNEYRNFIYHSHFLPHTMLLPEMNEKEHTGQGLLSLGYGVWDFVDLTTSVSYIATIYERELYEERSTGQWEEIYGFENINFTLHGGYDPINSLKDVLWFGGDINIGIAPSDTVFMRVQDDPDGRLHHGQLISNARRPFTTTGNSTFGADLLITGDFGRWLHVTPLQAHLNIGYASYTQNYHFTDFRVTPDSIGWAYSDSTEINLEVSDGVLNLGLGIELPTPYADIFVEYSKRKMLDRENAEVSYFTPGIRFKNNSGAFFNVSFDLSASDFDPLYYDLGHSLYQTQDQVTEEERAERAPLPIGGTFDYGVSISAGFSSDMVSNEESEDVSTLSGVVTDSITGLPVFATITFPGMAVANVTSDAETGFYTYNIPAGEVPVAVIAPGYKTANAIVIAEKNHSATLDFALVSNTGTLSGCIKDDQGRPIEGAKVTIGTPTPVIVTTDATGMFTAQVMGGTLPVAVQADGWITDNKSVTVIPGETVIVDFSLRAALREGEVMSFDNIYFDSGSANLKPESYTVLDSVAILMRDNPTARMQIAGHTDSDGSASSNQSLSERRAQSVYRYLTSTGIAGSRLSTAGFGESNPVAPNDSPANKARNRRIEFTVISI